MIAGAHLLQRLLRPTSLVLAVVVIDAEIPERGGVLLRQDDRGDVFAADLHVDVRNGQQGPSGVVLEAYDPHLVRLVEDDVVALVQDFSIWVTSSRRSVGKMAQGPSFAVASSSGGSSFT